MLADRGLRKDRDLEQVQVIDEGPGMGPGSGMEVPWGGSQVGDGVALGWEPGRGWGGSGVGAGSGMEETPSGNRVGDGRDPWVGAESGMEVPWGRGWVRDGGPLG